MGGTVRIQLAVRSRLAVSGKTNCSEFEIYLSPQNGLARQTIPSRCCRSLCPSNCTRRRRPSQTPWGLADNLEAHSDGPRSRLEHAGANRQVCFELGSEVARRAADQRTECPIYHRSGQAVNECNKLVWRALNLARLLVGDKGFAAIRTQSPLTEKLPPGLYPGRRAHSAGVAVRPLG